MTLNLTIEFKKSLFEDMEFIEKPNANAIKKLIKSKLLKEITNKMVLESYSTEQELLKTYISLLDCNDLLKVKYKRKTYQKYGRVYPANKIGAILLRKEIRQTLYKHNMTDIDIVNAHPTILYQLCIQNNINCKYLEKYVLNREKYLNELMQMYGITREQAKDLMIIIMYFGSIKKWLVDNNIKNTELNDFCIKFINELNSIADIIILKNQKFYKSIEKKNETDPAKNNKASFLSSYLQEHEERILECIYLYCKNNNYIYDNVCSLCYDGIMIETRNYKDKLLNELNEEVKKKIGFNLKFTVKEMDIDYLEDIKDITISVDKRVETDIDAAEIILSTIKNNFKCCYVSKSYQLYYKYSNIWTDDIEFIKNKLSLIVMNFGLYKVKRIKTKKGDEVEIKDFGRDLVEINHIVDSIIKIAKDNIDNEFYNKLHTSTKGKLCFLDGVLDVSKKKFYLWDDNELTQDPVYSVVCINRNFNDFFKENNETYKAEVKELIKSIMNDQTERCLEFLSRAIFGYIEDKDYSIFMGNRNCGKGVLNELLENSLTSQYIGTVEADKFLCERETSGDDGRKLNWLIDFQYKRLMTSNEIKFDKENPNIKLNGVLLKKVFSGGDKIKSREIYKGFIEFNIQSKMMLMCNDLPKITSTDCLETCIEFNTTNQFKSAEEIEIIKQNIAEKVKNTSNEIYNLELNKYKVADPTIKDRIKSNVNWLNAFILLMFDNWKSTKLQINKQSYDEEEESLTDIIFKYCDYKKDDNSYTITNEEIKHLSNMSKCSLKKLKIELYGLGGIDYRTSKERGLKYFKMKEEYKPKTEY
jgi:hypothetical protein